MSITTPTTKAISDNITAQMESSLNQSIPLLPKAFTRVLAKVLAGVFVMLYKYGGFIFQQLFVSTASDQETVVNGVAIVPLTELGRLIGVGDPIGATQSELVIDVEVNNQTGYLPAGSQVLGSTNGVTYITVGNVDLNAPVIQVTIRAVQDQSNGGGRGEIGNLLPGAAVSFANPLPNVERNAVVSSQVVIGVEAQTTESYRSRINDRWTSRPQGGAYADYRAWGTSVAGVAQVYPYTGDPGGVVNVYVESSTETDGVPSAGQLIAVSDAIELDDNGLATRRPVGALVNTLAITRTPWITNVAGLAIPSGVSDSQVKNEIIAAVESYYLKRKPFILGLDVLPRLDIISRSAVAGVVEDVSTSYGAVFSGVTIAQSSAPGAFFDNKLLIEGELVSSTVTFT